MLIAKQQKNSTKHHNHLRFSIAPHQSKPNGHKIKKNNALQQNKLHKNLSQLPIALKENATGSMANIMLGREYSSLVGSDVSASLSKSRKKKSLKKNRYQLPDRTQIQIDQVKEKGLRKKASTKKNQAQLIDRSNIEQNRNMGKDRIKKKRPSGASQSNSKWNNRSMQEDFSIIKSRLVQNRKKYNFSCNDMIDHSKSRSKQQSRIKRKKSTLNTTKINNLLDTAKEPIMKKKKNEKSSLKLKKMSLGALGKSKGSTGLVQKGNKKKQQEKENKEKKKKTSNKSKGKNVNKKKSKVFIFSKDVSDNGELDYQSFEEYPTNKYVSQKNKQKNKKQSLNIKVGVDYNNSLKINTLSSGMIYADSGMMFRDSNQVMREYPKQNFILEKMEYQNTGSINLEEIKRFQRQRGKFLTKNHQIIYKRKIRTMIQSELQEEYPYLNSLELNFLASIVFIQRKWRQYKFHSKNKVITEYILEDNQNSKDETLLPFIDLSKQRLDTISRTKLEYEQNLQQQRNQKQDDMINYSTRKRATNKKSELEVYEVESNEGEGWSKNSGRQARSEFNKAKYQWIQSKQVFPEMQYLEYRKKLIREQFQCTMKLIAHDFAHRVITATDFQGKKNQLMECYHEDIQNLKKTKHDLKKGYLRYIQCIQRVKESDSHSLQQCGLRKVSSQDNFIGVLYKKIYKFDHCISEGSQSSESIELLSKKILIRKQYYNQNGSSHKHSFQDIRSAARSSKSNFSLQKNSIQLNTLIFDKTQKIKLQKQQYQQIHKNQFNEIVPMNKDNYNASQNVMQLTKSMDVKQIKQISHSEKIPENKIEQMIKIIEDEVIGYLARDLQKDIHSINPTLVDALLIHMESQQSNQFNHNDDDQDHMMCQPILNSLKQQFKTILSPRNNSDGVLVAEDMDEIAQTLFYLRELIGYIQSENWVDQITNNMNNNQAFQALTYLRFLRDFEIPEDEYVPVISNENFIDWEAYFINNYELQMPRISSPEEQDIFKQSRAIFHRCIFQAFLSQLQKVRPYGEKGKPFPWQSKYTVHYCNNLSQKQLIKVLNKSVHKVEEELCYRCGIISEKHFIGCQQDLERMHEQNQDRIIEMLEEDLKVSRHDWYQNDQHLLQIELEISDMVEQQILEEMGLEFNKIIKNL